MPNGTRRAHARNGKSVRATTIKHPKPPKKRLTAGARRRAQHRPMLYAAGGLAGLGALDAILTGRWFTAGVLFAVAGGFLVTHVAWQAHKNRQARKPVRPQKAAAQQKREALEKAREPEPVEQEVAGKIKPRPAAEKAAPSKAAPNEWSTPRAAAEGEPTTHAESVARYGHRCDCRKCRAQRRAARAEKAVLR